MYYLTHGVMSTKKLSIKIPKLGTSDWDNIDKLFQLMELADKLKQKKKIAVFDAFDLITEIENNTEYCYNT